MPRGPRRDVLGGVAEAAVRAAGRAAPPPEVSSDGEQGLPATGARPEVSPVHRYWLPDA